MVDHGGDVRVGELLRDQRADLRSLVVLASI
jgi:hypothetical protein